MTVSSTTVKQSYSGNGSTSAFTYSFPINSTNELTVIIRNTTTGTERLRIADTGLAIFKGGLAEKYNNTGTTLRGQQRGGGVRCVDSTEQRETKYGQKRAAQEAAFGPTSSGASSSSFDCKQEAQSIEHTKEAKQRGGRG